MLLSIELVVIFSMLLFSGFNQVSVEDLITNYTGIPVGAQQAGLARFKGLTRSEKKSVLTDALGELYFAIESSSRGNIFDRNFANCLEQKVISFDVGRIDPTTKRELVAEVYLPCSFSAFIETYG